MNIFFSYLYIDNGDFLIDSILNAKLCHGGNFHSKMWLEFTAFTCLLLNWCTTLDSDVAQQSLKIWEGGGKE